jgi:hypothetical protein
MSVRETRYTATTAEGSKAPVVPQFPFTTTLGGTSYHLEATWI